MILSRVLFYILFVVVSKYTRMVEAKCEALSAMMDQVAISIQVWDSSLENFKAVGQRNGHYSDTTHFDIAEQYYNKIKKNLYQADIPRCSPEWNKIAYTIHHGQQNDEDFQDFQRKFDQMADGCKNEIWYKINCSRSFIDRGICTNNLCKG